MCAKRLLASFAFGAVAGVGIGWLWSQSRKRSTSKKIDDDLKVHTL